MIFLFGRWSRRALADRIKDLSKKLPSGKPFKLYYTFSRPRVDGSRGEFLWARKVGKNSARIESIPFGTGRVACGDLVRFNKIDEITKILEHVAKTRLLIYGQAVAPMRRSC